MAHDSSFSLPEHFHSVHDRLAVNHSRAPESEVIKASVSAIFESEPEANILHTSPVKTHSSSPY